MKPLLISVCSFDVMNDVNDSATLDVTPNPFYETMTLKLIPFNQVKLSTIIHSTKLSNSL